jgi:hypothetical protein
VCHIGQIGGDDTGTHCRVERPKSSEKGGPVLT